MTMIKKGKRNEKKIETINDFFTSDNTIIG